MDTSAVVLNQTKIESSSSSSSSSTTSLSSSTVPSRLAQKEIEALSRVGINVSLSTLAEPVTLSAQDSAYKKGDLVIYTSKSQPTLGDGDDEAPVEETFDIATIVVSKIGSCLLIQRLYI